MHMRRLGTWVLLGADSAPTAWCPSSLPAQDDLRTGVKVTGLLETPVEDMRGAMALVNGGYAARRWAGSALRTCMPRLYQGAL